MTHVIVFKHNQENIIESKTGKKRRVQIVHVAVMTQKENSGELVVA